MGSLSIFHWLIVLLIAVLMFGTKKLPSIGTDLGRAVRGFKDGLGDEFDYSGPVARVAPHQKLDEVSRKQ